MPWLAAAIAGGVLCALAGWLLVVAPVALAWLTTPVGSLSAPLRLGTQVWLLAHGAGATLDKLRVTLVPLGLTLVFLVMLVGVASWAARQAQLTHPDDDLPDSLRARLTGRVTLANGLSYGLSLGIVSFLTSTPQQTARALAGAVALGALGGAVGASRTLRWRPWQAWPRWVRLVVRSVAAALLVMVIASAAVLVTGLWRARGRITELAASLGADTLGQLALVVAQVAYLPNLLLWCGAWLVGAGFSLGDGSVVSPMWTQVGLLPAIPVAGAVPDPSYGRWVNLAWMAGGVVAGVAAAWVAGRERRVRFDEQALVGGLSGVVAGLAFSLVALLSRGDLGSGRLIGLGPRPVELVVMAPTLLGLAGLASGLVWGLVRPPLPQTESIDLTQPLPSPEEDDEATAALTRPLATDEDGADGTDR